MTFEEFKNSLNDSHPPTDIAAELRALWFDAQDDWDSAHEIAQNKSGANGSLVHAYLHRKEGDQGNADYWYRRAGSTSPSQSLKQEWESLVTRFLAKS